MCGGLLVWAPPAARACSVCHPGDPLFSAEGASAQRVGSFFLYLDTREVQKESGALPHDHEEEEGGARDTEENVSRDVTLFASWTPLDRFTLTATAPYKLIRIEEQPAGSRSSTFRNSGLGDVSLFSTVALWRNRGILPSSWLEGRLMLKFPTGTDSKRIGGELDPHLQLGTGSWDWGLGLAGAHRRTRGVMNGSIFYRFNSEGSLDYEYGDVLLANLGWTSDALEFGLLPRRSGIRGGAELNFRYAGRDDFRGQSYPDSGGSIFYASPFLELRVGPSHAERTRTVRLGARIPLGNGGLNGYQKEGYVFFLGLGVGF